MSAADEFLDLYKKLEQSAIDIYGFAPDGRAIGELERMKQYEDIRRELKYCRDVRNLLSHNEKIDSSYSVEPSRAMIALLKDAIFRVENPGRCIDYATKQPYILLADIETPALKLMREMTERGFSHVPLVQDGVVTAVFSASTPFSYILEHGGAKLDEGTTLRYFEKYLPINMHATESFRYLSRMTLLTAAQTLFVDSLKEARRIGMIFVTENGKPHEKLLGVITPHDIMDS